MKILQYTRKVFPKKNLTYHLLYIMDTEINVENELFCATVVCNDMLDKDDLFLMDHEIKIQDEKYENTWDSCCLRTDKRAVQYFSQIFIITGIMIFNIYQLVTLKECSEQGPYMSLLTFLIGVLIPNPNVSVYMFCIS